MSKRVAVIVAMEREIAPLLRAWRRKGKRVRRGKYGAAASFHCEQTVVLVSGIGREFASIAADYVKDPIGAELVISAGLAGSLSRTLEAGGVVRPVEVIDAATAERYPTHCYGKSAGILITAASVLSRQQ